MITIKEGTVKKNKGKVVIGFDMGDVYSQISFLSHTAAEPETVSAITGTELYNIPTVLAKRPLVSQWFYGREAVKYAEQGGIVVDNLVSRALRGEEVMVENESFDPIALLALFVKRTLSLLTMHVSMKDIEAFMFTVEHLDNRMVEVLNRLVGYLQLDCPHISYQSHVESFYAYMIHQPRELWQYQVLVLEYNDILTSMRFECSRNTTPEVAFIHCMKHEDIKRRIWSEDEDVRKGEMAELDEIVCDTASNILKEGDITTVYLLGDGFKETWASETLKVLCKNRRVFQGNNLYSKGAALSIMDKLYPSEISKTHVYLGEDKVKSNVGLRALRRGEESYLALLDAGTNWYEVNTDMDILVEEGNEIGFLITSLTGGHVIEKNIVLDGLPKRPRGATRLRIHIEMTNVDTLAVDIEDLGFGELIESSGRAWSQIVEL